MGHFEQSAGGSDEWYTPPYVFAALAETFDLDVAHPGLDIVPWVPARNIITEQSLEKKWRGFVWCNPPFGGRNGIVPWLDKFFEHGDGVALMPDRTSAQWWQDASERAGATLFVAPKVRFLKADETEGPQPSNGTALMACGRRGVTALLMAEAQGLGKVFRRA